MESLEQGRQIVVNELDDYAALRRARFTKEQLAAQDAEVDAEVIKLLQERLSESEVALAHATKQLEIRLLHRITALELLTWARNRDWEGDSLSQVVDMYITSSPSDRQVE
jgi:hypothetical protein